MDVVLGEEEEEEVDEVEVEEQQQQQQSSSLGGNAEKEEIRGLSPSPILPFGSLEIEMLKAFDARLCDFGDFPLSHSQSFSSFGCGAGGEEPRRLGASRHALAESELEGGVRSRAGAMIIGGESRHEERSCGATAPTSREPGHVAHIQMLERMLARAGGRGVNGCVRYGPQVTEGAQMALHDALAAADLHEDEGIALLSPEGVPPEERCIDQEQLYDLSRSHSSMRPRRLVRLQRCLACCPACFEMCCSIL